MRSEPFRNPFRKPPSPQGFLPENGPKFVIRSVDPTLCRRP